MIDIKPLIKRISDLGLDKNPKVIALLRSLIMNPRNEDRWRQLNRILGPALTIEEFFGKPFKRANELVNGEIKFAFTEQNLPIGINLIEPHILIAGQTGSGKSVLLMLILVEAIIQGV